MTPRRRVVVTVVTVFTTAALATVAGCTSGSTRNGPSATATVTTTAPASSAAPSTGTAPAPVSTPPAGSTAPAGTTSSAGAGSDGVGLCTPTVATFDVGASDAGLSHAGFVVHVTNASKQPCVTTGYPGVALLDASGRQVEQAQRTPGGYLGGLANGAQPATITLQPGQQATSLIEGTDFDPTTGGACATSPALLFTLPDNTDSTRLLHDTYACPGLQVHPLIPGTTGRS